jgi:hypothetical protein
MQLNFAGHTLSSFSMIVNTEEKKKKGKLMMIINELDNAMKTMSNVYFIFDLYHYSVQILE